MNLSTLVIVAGVAAFCASPAWGQQSSSSQANQVLNQGSGNAAPAGSQPGEAKPASTPPPAVDVSPDQVRPIDKSQEKDKSQPAASSGSAPSVSTPATPPSPSGAPSEPVPNPNPAPPHPKSSAASRDIVGAGPPPPDAPYIVGPLDVLEIRVWNDPKLTGMYPVRPDGMISLPLIGEFKADGYSIPKLTGLVKQKLSAMLTEPEVNIQVVKINSKRVFVFGGVMRPGEMPLEENMTVLDALSGLGFKDFANTKKIVIMRGTRIFHFNYNEVSKGKRMEQNIYLQNGDRIFVPE